MQKKINEEYFQSMGAYRFKITGNKVHPPMQTSKEGQKQYRYRYEMCNRRMHARENLMFQLVINHAA